MTNETPPKPESPISFRPGSVLRRTLDNHIATHDLVRSRFIRAAITEKLHRDRAAARSKPSSPFPD